MDQNEFMEGIARRKHGTSSFFDRVAAQYDRSGPRFFSYFGRRLVELAKIPPGARVLDLATGRGAVLLPAAEAAGSHGHVTGVDLSEQMVVELNREIQQTGAEHIQVLRMDVEYLQFPDASFDVVLCGFALFFFPQLDKAMAEMFRVLRKGGTIALSLWDKSMDEQWKWFFQAAQAHLPPEPEGKPIPSRPPSANLDSTAGMQQVLENAGFIDVRVMVEAHDVRYADLEEWWAALWMHWTRNVLERIEKTSGADGLERFKQDLFTRMQSAQQPDGIHQIFPAVLGVARKP